ncbi:MAG: head GIN domain-containing protein [Saprospiraceae bacterium]
MKKLISISFLFTMLTTILAAQYQPYRGLVEERAVESFSELEVSGYFNIYLRQGDTTMVEIASMGVPLHEVNVYNSGDRLIIDRDRQWSWGKLRRVDIYLQVVDLERIEMDGVGNVYSEETLAFQRLSIECSGVGKAFLDVEVAELNIEMDGLGGISLQGNAERAYIENTGVGKVDAYELKTQFMKVENTSIGSVWVQAEQELRIESSGIGSVHIRGEAEVKRLDISGLGRVHHERRRFRRSPVNL